MRTPSGCKKAEGRQREERAREKVRRKGRKQADGNVEARGGRPPPPPPPPLLDWASGEVG